MHDVIIRVFSQLEFRFQQCGTVDIFSEPEILALHKSSTELLTRLQQKCWYLDFTTMDGSIILKVTLLMGKL